MCQASFVSILVPGFNKMEASTRELAGRKQEPERGRPKGKGGGEGGQNDRSPEKSGTAIPL